MTDSPSAPSAGRPPLARAALSAVLAAGAILWAIGGAKAQRAQRHWEEAFRKGPIEAAAAPVPANPAAWRSLGDIYLSQFFPPADDLAIRAYRQALLLDPRSSVTWTRLAEAQFFSGDRAAAEASLSRADALDPNFPRQRLEAIRLWALLGREDRALGLGAGLARLGPQARADALRELSRLGHEPADLFRRLQLATTPPVERPALLDAFEAAYGRDALARLSHVLPAPWLENRPFRHRAIEAALRPVRYAEALRWWHLELGLPFEDDSGAIFAPNLDLASDPFSQTGPLGWQAPSASPMARTVWVPPSAAEPGMLAFQFERRYSQPFDAPLWVGILPPGLAVELSIDVQMEPAERSRVDLVFGGGGEELMQSLPAGRTEWQTVSKVLPATPEGRVLRLRMIRHRVGVPEPGEEPSVRLRNLTLRPAGSSP